MICCFEFLTPFTLRGCNFLVPNLFLTIVSVLDAQREGVQVLFGHQKQQRPPLGSNLPSTHMFGYQPVYPTSLIYAQSTLWKAGVFLTRLINLIKCIKLSLACDHNNLIASPFLSGYASSNWWRFLYLVVPYLLVAHLYWAVCLPGLWSLPLFFFSLPFLCAFFL